MFLPGYPVSPDFADTGRRCRLYPLLYFQKSIQHIFNGLSDQPVQMLHNLFFIDFDGSRD